ncbi:hypothetical protein Vafri_17435 [Volvox africanus]|uniref:Uncharacterized protein n=1 Tax=Volvox africanus TaxID=51714 RepID=A0A8J4BQH9_9CHLO|nr:hypothetical protein Vafri_17435 [Volvox africanus]
MDTLGKITESLPDTDEANTSSSSIRPTVCTSQRVSPTVRQRNFVTQTHDAALHFQILDLGRQYYIWVSAVGPKLGSLYLAIKTPADKTPAVASLMTMNAAGDEGPAMAQRLALKLGKPVVCSCNLPQNAPLLQAVAERRLMQELQAMEMEAAEHQHQQPGQEEQRERQRLGGDGGNGSLG